MALRKKGKYRYGESQEDIRDELLRFSKLNEYKTEYYANAQCVCGNNKFTLSVDDDEGAAIRRCIVCNINHPIGDSNDFLEDAKLIDCECPCGSDSFEITVGISLYQNTYAVKWLYIGCRCINCKLTACYADWKNEYEDYRTLLNKI